MQNECKYYMFMYLSMKQEIERLQTFKFEKLKKTVSMKMTKMKSRRQRKMVRVCTQATLS